jgi:hypothetical protein
MIPMPHDYPHDDLRQDHLHAGRQAGPGSATPRPRWQPGEEVEGWVTAEITPYPRSLGSLEAPYAAQFVLAVVEYPSGAAGQWGRLHWRAVDIVLRSDTAWPVVVDCDSAPIATPALEELVNELAHQALALGWEPAGRGRTWCSLRFRMRYAQLRGQLQWR